MSEKKLALNPYLPLDTYIPDGEPHVFGDRIYVFGSHDKENGDTFCMLDYEGFSAPVDDLGDWRSEGIIYRADQDPTHGDKYKYMYAPDVVRGCDGRYYLYYAMAGGCFTGPIHVAVCDTPAGKYEYYGEVRNPDGSTFDRCITFDPGVINDDGKIYLYYGWALAAPQMKGQSKAALTVMKKNVMPKLEMQMFEKTKEQIKREPEGIQGANVVRLAEDMLTVIDGPKRILPGQIDGAGTEFEGHAFFEASSIRKIGETYYYIYSSEVNHELCYATSRYPDRDFSYGGVIISNGDIGYQGRAEKDRLAMTGNNHGSIEQINGQWYIFYHRHTNKTSYSRQGCAEPIEIKPDGSIAQVEMTSCGLNGGCLPAKGTYPAAIACNLTKGEMPHISADGVKEDLPYITCKEGERIIADFSDGSVAGYKYFDFEGTCRIGVEFRGDAQGVLILRTGEDQGDVLGEIPVASTSDWQVGSAKICAQGNKALYLEYTGAGRIDMKNIVFLP